MRLLRYGLVIALIAAIAFTVAGCSKEPLAATVNGKNITVAQVDHRLDQMQNIDKKMFEGEQGQQVKYEFRDKILEDLISKELLLQEADKFKITVTDKEIDAKLKEVMEIYGIKSQAELEEALKQQKISMKEFREEIKIGVKIEKLGNELTKNIKAKDKELQDYYNSHKTEFIAKDQLHVAHILVAKEDDAKNILKELQNGADFADLAKKNSIDPGSKEQGGDLGMSDKDKYVPEFSAAAWELEPGKISELVKTEYGYHIIKMIAKKASYQKTFKEAKPEVEEKVLAPKKQEYLAEWFEKLKEKADIKKYLTQPKSKPSQTSTDTAPGGTVPEGHPDTTNTGE